MDGAAAGQLACIASVIRTSIRYGNLDLIEDGYGINMVPLATFAMDAYRDDPCRQFVLKDSTDEERSKKETLMNRKMHKAKANKKKKQEEKLKKQQKQQQSGNDTTDTSINNIEKQIKKLLN